VSGVLDDQNPWQILNKRLREPQSSVGVLENRKVSCSCHCVRPVPQPHNLLIAECPYGERSVPQPHNLLIAECPYGERSVLQPHNLLIAECPYGERSVPQPHNLLIAECPYGERSVPELHYRTSTDRKWLILSTIIETEKYLTECTMKPRNVRNR
jgi:hypothetical protein